MSEVIFTPVTLIPSVVDGELSQDSYRTCGYCGKEVLLNVVMQSLHEKFAGVNRFYCSFCLRHNLHLPNENILSLSLRSLIGYYYHFHYLKGRKMYLSEIGDRIACHKTVGLSNPLFNYDPETFLWFIDFSRVDLIGVNEVLETLDLMVECFRLEEGRDRFCKKLHDAVMQFHVDRSRPKGRRLLIPTLRSCVKESRKCLEKTRNFLPQDMKI